MPSFRPSGLMRTFLASIRRREVASRSRGVGTRGDRTIVDTIDELFEAVDDFERSGRYRSAIDALERANRTRRDSRIERRLLQVRRRAFLANDSTKRSKKEGPRDRGLWKRWFRVGTESQGPDLFPDVRVPEISASALECQVAQNAIANHGSLLVRGLLNEEQVSRLVDDIDSTFDAFEAWCNGEPVENLDGWYEPYESDFLDDEVRKHKFYHGHILAVESPRSLFDLIEILHESGIGGLAREYVGEDPTIMARKVSLRRNPGNRGGGWHQDGAFMGKDIRSINSWIALTPCGVDAPSLDIVGRRIDHIVPTGGAGASNKYSIGPADAEAVTAGAIVRPQFDPGDGLLFDHLLLHRTGLDRDTMTKPRHAIEAWFMAPSTYSFMTRKVDEGFQPRDQVPIAF